MTGRKKSPESIAKRSATIIAQNHRGERSWHWKGGFTTQDGYSFNRVKGQYQHRAIMERHLSKKLGRDEVVHHKDFNRMNNDLGNLMIMTRSEHMRKHMLRHHRLRRENDINK